MVEEIEMLESNSTSATALGYLYDSQGHIIAYQTWVKTPNGGHTEWVYVDGWNHVTTWAGWPLTSQHKRKGS